MRVRYPVTLCLTATLSVGVSALAVMWNVIHVFGLIAVIGGMFLLPVVSRWEGRRQ